MKMIKNLILLSLFFYVIAFQLSCSKSEEKDLSNVIAQINGDVLTEDMLVELAGVNDINDLSESEKKSKMDEWIKISLLAHEADKRGLTQNPTVKARFILAEKTIKANLLLSNILHNISPSESELFNYYQIHKGRYLQDREEYRIQRILFHSEELADSVSSMIINNEITFSEAARNFSQEQARESDGYIGYITLEEMDDQTRRVVSNLSQWRYTKIRGNEGFFLLRYGDVRKRKSEQNFTEVIDQIREEYIAEKRSDFIDQEIKKLMDESEIIISR